MAGPLSHIRVLDLTRVLAGPWCGQNLADLGAEVIKVERPKKGDDSRAYGPPWVKDASGKDTKEAAYFMAANRGKNSITIDIAKPEGQALDPRARQAAADVLLENYKTGDLAALRARLRRPENAQSAAHLLLDHRLRPDRPLPRARRASTSWCRAWAAS